MYHQNAVFSITLQNYSYPLFWGGCDSVTTHVVYVLLTVLDMYWKPLLKLVNRSSTSGFCVSDNFGEKNYLLLLLTISNPLEFTGIIDCFGWTHQTLPFEHGACVLWQREACVFHCKIDYNYIDLGLQLQLISATLWICTIYNSTKFVCICWKPFHLIKSKSNSIISLGYRFLLTKDMCALPKTNPV